MSSSSISLMSAIEKELPDLESELQIQNLTDENERLKNDYQKLKVQFDEAVSINDDFEKMHQKNIDLTSKIKSLELERDDLQRRLQLNISSFQDQLEKEKQNSAMRYEVSSKEISDLRQRLENCLKEKNTLQEECSKKTNDLQFQCDTESRKASVFEAKLKQIMEAADQAFNTSFVSPEALKSFLTEFRMNYANEINLNNCNNSCNRNNSLNTSINTVASESKDHESELLIKKLLRKVKQLKEQNNQMKNELADTQTSYKKLQSSSIKSKEKMDHTIAQLTSKLESQETYYQRLIDQMNHNLNQTREELQVKSQMMMPIPPNIVASQENCINKVRDQYINEINSLKKQYNKMIREMKENESMLKKNLSEEVKDKNASKEQVNQLENQVQELNLEKSKLLTERDNLLKQNEFIENERKTIQEELVKLATSKKEIESKHEESLMQKIKAYECNLNKNKIQISSQQVQLTKYQNENTSLKNDLRKMKDHYTTLKSQYEESINSNQKLTQQLNQAPKSVKPDDILPPSCFIIPGIPPELSSSITQVINNDSLQPASKVQIIFSTMKSYYSKEVSRLTDNLKQCQSEINDRNSSMSQFINQFCDLLGMQKVTSDELALNTQKFAQLIIHLKNRYEQLAVENQNLEKEVSEFKNRLGCPPDQDISSFIGSLFDEIETTKTNHAILAKRFLLLRRNKRNIKKKLIQQIQILSNDFEKSKSELKLYSSKIENLTNDLESLNKEKQKLDFELVEYKQKYDNMKYANDTLNQERNSIVDRTSEALKNELKQEITNLNDQIRVLSNQNESYQKNISLFKRAISVLKTKLSQSLNLISELKKANTKEKEECNMKCEKARESVQKINDEAISQLRKQCTDLREALSALNQKITELESKNSKLTKSNRQYKRQYYQINRQMGSLAEDVNREKKIMENQFQTQKIKIESEAASQLLATKTEADKEKQQLIAYFADNFRCFFDPNEQIDSSMYQRLIDRAKTELDRLQSTENSIRRMTNAAPYQSTEDAVAQYIFKSTNPPNFVV